MLCPPTLSERETRCVVKLGPPALGTTKISVGSGHTLTACEPRFPCKKSFRNIAVHMEASFQPQWPLGFPHIVTYCVKSNRDLTQIYKYIHNLTIYFNRMCDTANSRVQMMVYVEISHCITSNQGHKRRLVINDVPCLSEQCIDPRIVFSLLLKTKWKTEDITILSTEMPDT